MPYIVKTPPVTKQTLELSAGLVQSSISTTTSTGISTLVSLASTVYRSVNYHIQTTEGTNYNKTTINVIHNGTTAYLSEFGTINEPIGVATFSADINGDNLRLLGFPASANSTTFKVIYTALDA
jgi:hypothetical protein|tara:strand:- start:192 stop:563 length:372 start_codon:yes stop_codon:yes gene_type:complete